MPPNKTRSSRNPFSALRANDEKLSKNTSQTEEATLVSLLSDLSNPNLSQSDLNTKLNSYFAKIAGCTDVKIAIEKKFDELMQDQDFQTSNLNYDLILKNLDRLRQAQNRAAGQEQLEREDQFYLLMEWLRKLVFFHQVIRQNKYQESLARIRTFTIETKPSVGDRIYNSIRSIMAGIGIGSSVFNFGPLITFGLLGFAGVSLPLLAIPFVNIAFAIVGMGIGSAILTGQVVKTINNEKSFKDEIKQLTNKAKKLALKEAELRLLNNNLKLEYQKLIDEHPGIKFEWIENKPTVTSTQREQSRENSRSLSFNSTWLDTIGSFASALGTGWGLPYLILGLCGISLLAGSSFMTGGLALAGAALLASGIYAAKTYFYEKKSRQKYIALEKLQAEQSTALKNQDIIDLKNENKAFELNISRLKAKIKKQNIVRATAAIAPALAEISKQNDHEKLQEAGVSAESLVPRLGLFGQQAATNGVQTSPVEPDAQPYPGVRISIGAG